MAGPKSRRHTKRVPSGDSDVMVEQNYCPPLVSNPGNVIQISQVEGGSVVEARVGGGHIGDQLAHLSEAPMPVGLAERFVKWFAPSGSVVLDCFAGSGTTGVAALNAGRRFIGVDVRQSQVELAHRRLFGCTPSLFDTLTDDPAD